MRLLLLLLNPELRPQERHWRLPVRLASLARVLGPTGGTEGTVRPPSIVKVLGVNPSQGVGALGPDLVSLAGLAEVGLAVGPDVGQTSGVLAGVVGDVV